MGERTTTMINLMPWLIIWAVLATGVLVLAGYRQSVSRKEDDYIHVDSTKAVAQQQTINKKLEAIDRWGKPLTVIVGILALVLLGLFLWNGWHDTGRAESLLELVKYC